MSRRIERERTARKPRNAEATPRRRRLRRREDDDRDTKSKAPLTEGNAETVRHLAMLHDALGDVISTFEAVARELETVAPGASPTIEDVLAELTLREQRRTAGYAKKKHGVTVSPEALGPIPLDELLPVLKGTGFPAVIDAAHTYARSCSPGDRVHRRLQANALWRLSERVVAGEINPVSAIKEACAIRKDGGPEAHPATLRMEMASWRKDRSDLSRTASIYQLLAWNADVDPAPGKRAERFKELADRVHSADLASREQGARASPAHGAVLADAFAANHERRRREHPAGVTIWRLFRPHRPPKRV